MWEIDSKSLWVFLNSLLGVAALESVGFVAEGGLSSVKRGWHPFAALRRKFSRKSNCGCGYETDTTSFITGGKEREESWDVGWYLLMLRNFSWFCTSRPSVSYLGILRLDKLVRLGIEGASIVVL